MRMGPRALLFVLVTLLHAASGQAEPRNVELLQSLENKVLLRVATERVVGSFVMDAMARTFLIQEGLKDIEIHRNAALTEATYTGISHNGAKRQVVITVMPRLQALAAMRGRTVDAALVGQARIAGGGQIVQDERQFEVNDVIVQVGETAAFIIVHPNNPVKQLTFRQLRLILLGAITDWSQVGGRPGKIRPVGTPQMQPSIDLVADLIHLDPTNLDAEAKSMLRAQADKAPVNFQYASSAEVFARIATDPDAMTIQFPLIPTSVKSLKLGANEWRYVAPVPETIKNKDYALAYRINLHYPTGKASYAVKALVKAATSLEMEVGMALAGAALAGTEMLAMDVDESAPREYLNATKFGVMVSKSIHFKADGVELTDDGRKAIDRVADKLLSIRQDAGKVRLVGFTDRMESAQVSKSLGLQFAKFVAMELKKRNVNTGSVYSIGDLMPIDEDSTTHGRERNRRVQVWLVP